MESYKHEDAERKCTRTKVAGAASQKYDRQGSCLTVLQYRARTRQLQERRQLLLSRGKVLYTAVNQHLL